MSSQSSPDENEIYERLRQRILDANTLSLQGANYEQDFVRRFTSRGHQLYMPNDPSARDECHFLLFGQTCNTASGTQMSSQGNYSSFNVRMSVQLILLWYPSLALRP